MAVELTEDVETMEEPAVWAASRVRQHVSMCYLVGLLCRRRCYCDHSQALLPSRCRVAVLCCDSPDGPLPSRCFIAPKAMIAILTSSSSASNCLALPAGVDGPSRGSGGVDSGTSPAAGVGASLGASSSLVLIHVASSSEICLSIALLQGDPLDEEASGVLLLCRLASPCCSIVGAWVYARR